MQSTTDSTLDAPPTRAARIVIAEDDAELRRIIAGKFRSAGYDTVEIATGTLLADYLIVRNGIDEVDAIISDVRMPGLSGIDMLAYLQARGYHKPTVLITGFGDWSTLREAQTFGALSLFDKPVDVDDLLQFVRQFLPARIGPFEGAAPAD
jgi:DNA-binding NtrC family response regulator